jgi:hypothetical protein
MSTEAEPLTGGCICGYVRYQLTSRPMFVHCCHCRACQRESGSAFAINALIERDRLELLAGSVHEVVSPTPSGKGQRTARCPRCQWALWSHYAYGAIADVVCFVRVGALDEPWRVPPDIHIFTESKQPWVTLPEGVPAVPQFYKASEVWPKESLERRAALVAALKG